MSANSKCFGPLLDNRLRSQFHSNNQVYGSVPHITISIILPLTSNTHVGRCSLNHIVDFSLCSHNMLCSPMTLQGITVGVAGCAKSPQSTRLGSLSYLTPLILQILHCCSNCIYLSFLVYSPSWTLPGSRTRHLWFGFWRLTLCTPSHCLQTWSREELVGTCQTTCSSTISPHPRQHLPYTEHCGGI